MERVAVVSANSGALLVAGLSATSAIRAVSTASAVLPLPRLSVYSVLIRR